VFIQANNQFIIMQVGQLVTKVMEEMFPQAIQKLKECTTNQEAAVWRRSVVIELSKCMMEGEEP